MIESKQKNRTVGILLISMRTIKFVLVSVLLVGGVTVGYLSSQQRATVTRKEVEDRLGKKAAEALTFCQSKGYNTDFCILIDMKEHPGKYRLFVWNFKDKGVERKALCAHGCGKGDKMSTEEKPVFSNVEGSLLTSLGKYKIGNSAYSQYGIHIHYKLYGLEATNSNAFKRVIVLHSHTPVPATEIYPVCLPLGWSFGCPVTDNETMRYLDGKLKRATKPVLLWIYD